MERDSSPLQRSVVSASSSALSFGPFNISVRPREPLLELSVSGEAVTEVLAGDVVIADCQARGGHPHPDISISLKEDLDNVDNIDNKIYQNSLSFTASSEDDGKTIVCTAENKMGTATSSAVIKVRCKSSTSRLKYVSF